MRGTAPSCACFDRCETARRQESENRRPQTGHVALRHQNRLVQHVGVNLVELIVLLRNAAAVDDALNRRAVLLHALQNHARVKRGAFNGGEQFVLRRAGQIPTQA